VEKQAERGRGGKTHRKRGKTGLVGNQSLKGGQVSGLSKGLLKTKKSSREERSKIHIGYLSVGKEVVLKDKGFYWGKIGEHMWRWRAGCRKGTTSWSTPNNDKHPGKHGILCLQQKKGCAVRWWE